MPGAADAQDLEIDSAGGPDAFLVMPAMRVDLTERHGAVGQVNVGTRDVDVVEEMHPHELVIALRVGRLQRIVFVEIERDDVREAQVLFVVNADELRVYADRSRSGGKPEHGRPPLALP